MWREIGGNCAWRVVPCHITIRPSPPTRLSRLEPPHQGRLNQKSDRKRIVHHGRRGPPHLPAPRSIQGREETGTELTARLQRPKMWQQQLAFKRHLVTNSG